MHVKLTTCRVSDNDVLRAAFDLRQVRGIVLYGESAEVHDEEIPISEGDIWVLPAVYLTRLTYRFPQFFAAGGVLLPNQVALAAEGLQQYHGLVANSTATFDDPNWLPRGSQSDQEPAEGG